MSRARPLAAAALALALAAGAAGGQTPAPAPAPGSGPAENAGRIIVAPDPDGRPQAGLPRAPVTVTLASGATLDFDAEVADRPETRAVGMMFRPEIADDAAMLFVYDRPQPATFWMRNTLIPLDILFIDADGFVTRVYAEAVPGDLTGLPSGGPIRSVLEIRGGLAAELGIGPGARVASIALTRAWPALRGGAQ
ncbi:MAG: DUF192 domain-containing protein [Pseudomonadota bacterium]